MGRLGQEVRFAARTLIRSRFVTTLAVLAFALGIGVTSAVFSIFNGVLLRPLPFPDWQDLVMVYDTQPACSTCPASFPKYTEWKTRNTVFATIGGSVNVSLTLTGAGEPTRIPGVGATASLVDVFGVPPLLGRWHTEQEDQFGGPLVVVLAHDLWTRQFNADPSILGRRLTFDGKSYEVIGVMPLSFSHRRAQFFVPLQRKLDPATRTSHFLPTYARLKKGVTLERATAEMRALGHVLAAEFGHNHGIDLRSYYEVVVGGVRSSLWMLMGAVLLVLLIACANVANLLLASGMARRREFAIRLALGAGRGTLARQLATESLLLAVTGGILGILLARWMVGLFVVLAGNQLPRATTIEMDGRVLAFAAVTSVVVGVFCGVWPLLRLRPRELTSAVREGDTRTSSGGRRLGNGLVVAEIAIAFALLVGAGLLVKNLVLLSARDAGIRTDRIVSFNVAPAGPRYGSPEQVVAFYHELYSRLTAVENVESAGMTSHLPMVEFGWNGEFQIEGDAPWTANQAPLVEYRWLHGEYLKTLAVPLLRGRPLDSRDGKGSTTVLINQAMADKFWPGQDAIGKRFGQGRTDRAQWYEVVGVVGSVRSLGLTRNSPYEFYRTIDQSSFGSMSVVVRTRGGDPSTVIPAVRQIVASIDPTLPITQVQTMEEVVSASVGQPRLMSALTALFGVLAGLLAMIGVYGVMAYNVRRQRREFGIRLALGAGESSVRNLVIGRGLLLAATGVVLGAGGAWLLGGVVTALLNDVKPTDPVVFVATGLAILAVATLASYLPARAAARVDPIVVLRE